MFTLKNCRNQKNWYIPAECKKRMPFYTPSCWMEFHPNAYQQILHNKHKKLKISKKNTVIIIMSETNCRLLWYLTYLCLQSHWAILSVTSQFKPHFSLAYHAYEYWSPVEATRCVSLYMLYRKQFYIHCAFTCFIVLPSTDMLRSFAKNTLIKPC